MLTNLLRAYSRIDPKLGYTQGMNFIAAVIIRTLYNKLKGD
jgi:hypothetical protein